MRWFVAHVVMSVKIRELPQEHFPVWENMVLVSAKSEREAFSKAERHGRLEEGDDDGSFTWGGKPAEWVFQGVRKITECSLAGNQPSDGDELSFNELDFNSMKAVEHFASGASVAAEFVDRFPAKRAKRSEPTRTAKRKGA